MLGSEKAFSYAIACAENLLLIDAIPFELRPEEIIDALSREGERNERAQKLS